METKTVIKYGAYALAAYVVYRYVSAQPWFQSLLTMGTAAGTENPTGATQTQQPQQPQQTQQTQTASPASAQPVAETFLRAVVDETYARQLPVTVALNPDQWNWYRAQATGQQQPDPLMMGYTDVTRGYAITARQYWDALQTVGMSGMPWQAYEARVN